jgi:Transposase DDE domain group 1
VFCGRHLLAAKLRPANIDAAAGTIEEIGRIVAQIRARWPQTRIILRADSGFARDALMGWREANAVDYIFGLARNARLKDTIAAELAEAQQESQQTGKPARRFKDFTWSTRKSWSRERRVIAKAEWTKGEENPRFIVTTLTTGDGRHLYEEIYCARGEMENRIKECQTPPVVCLNGLCSGRRHPSSGSAGDRSCRCHLWHHPPQALQDRRPRHHQRSSGQVRHGVRLSLQGRLCNGASCPRYDLSRDRFADSTSLTASRFRAPVSTRKPCNLQCQDSPRAKTALAADRKTQNHPGNCSQRPKPSP